MNHPPASELAERLQQRRDEALYRRQRAVRWFAHRLRVAAILISLLWLLLAYILALLRLRWQVTVPQIVDQGLMVLLWLYAASLPLLLAWRTRLRAYVLYEHWAWLVLWLALPLDWFVLRVSVGRWSWIPVLTLALLVLGRLLRRWRWRRFRREMIASELLWQRLLPLGVLDLLTWGFWSRR